MKNNLTNLNTVIVFEQYGEIKVYLYHGDFKEAKRSLNFGRAIPYSKMLKMGQYESVGFFTPETSEVISYKELQFDFIADWYNPSKKELTPISIVII
jgi:hypothetical protein